MEKEKQTPNESKSNVKDVLPEAISKTTGTHNRTHDAHNMGGMTSTNVNSAGNSIAGHTSDTAANLQANQNAREKEVLEKSKK